MNRNKKNKGSIFIETLFLLPLILAFLMLITGISRVFFSAIEQTIEAYATTKHKVIEYSAQNLNADEYPCLEKIYPQISKVGPKRVNIFSGFSNTAFEIFREVAIVGENICSD